MLFTILLEESGSELHVDKNLNAPSLMSSAVNFHGMCSRMSSIYGYFLFLNANKIVAGVIPPTKLEARCIQSKLEKTDAAFISMFLSNRGEC